VVVLHNGAGVTAQLYCGDCLAILPTLEAGSIDAVVTDPPYGVGFTGKAGHYRNEPNAKRHDTYTTYDDTEVNWFQLVLPAIEELIALGKPSAFFMSDARLFDMPKGGNIGGIFLPNGCGNSRWGFQCFMHVAFYGKCPYLAARLGSRPNGKYGIYGNDSNKIAHPCAKPLAAMKWLVQRTSLDGFVVLDPFMGSGTTGVACAQLGRDFIGIEIDPGYFAIAEKRISEALTQPQLPGLMKSSQSKQIPMDMMK